MTDVTESRRIIQTEEVDAESGLTEDLFFRVGETTNFIAKRQYDTHGWHLNRLYKIGVGVEGRDGIFPVLFNMEIVGITMWNRLAGISGTTTLDVHWLSASGVDEGTVFSTKPAFNINTGNQAYLIKNVESGVVEAQPSSGAIEPIFSKTQFNAGDALKLIIDDAMTGAEDCSLLIHFRPR